MDPGNAENNGASALTSPAETAGQCMMTACLRDIAARVATGELAGAPEHLLLSYAFLRARMIGRAGLTCWFLHKAPEYAAEAA